MHPGALFQGSSTGNETLPTFSQRRVRASWLCALQQPSQAKHPAVAQANWFVCFGFFFFFSRETRFLVSSMFSIQGISLSPWLP